MAGDQRPAVNYLTHISKIVCVHSLSPDFCRPIEFVVGLFHKVLYVCKRLKISR